MRRRSSSPPSSASSAASFRRRRRTSSSAGSAATAPSAARTTWAMFDADARRIAVDPTQNVVLEASAGTGKTRVLVERYVNLLLAGVDPHNILAITFTRKAAAEMRQRVIERLKEIGWGKLPERIGDIEIPTIDAC